VLTKLLGLQYKIIYEKGVDKRVADALSRRVHVDDQCLLSLLVLLSGWNWWFTLIMVIQTLRR
jgi:hypothetical protein